MAKVSSFNVLYLAGMAALMLVATVAAMLLTGERRSGFVGAIEMPVLLVGAVLFVAGGVGAVRSRGASWPLLAAVAGVVLVGVLAFVTLTLPDAGSAPVFEVPAVVVGLLLVAVIRKD